MIKLFLKKQTVSTIWDRKGAQGTGMCSNVGNILHLELGGGFISFCLFYCFSSYLILHALHRMCSYECIKHRIPFFSLALEAGRQRPESHFPHNLGLLLPFSNLYYLNLSFLGSLLDASHCAMYFPSATLVSSCKVSLTWIVFPFYR